MQRKPNRHFRVAKKVNSQNYFENNVWKHYFQTCLDLHYILSMCLLSVESYLFATVNIIH